MSRAVVFAVPLVLAACGGAQRGPELAPLADPAAPTPAPPAAPVLTADFTVPASAPVGPPIVISRFVPEVGVRHAKTGRILRLDQLETRTQTGKMHTQMRTESATAITYE